MVNQSHTGAIPHSLTGNGSMDSNSSIASSARATGQHSGGHASETRTGSVVARLETRLVLGVSGKLNHPLIGDDSVQASKNATQERNARRAVTRPSPCELPADNGKPS